MNLIDQRYVDAVTKTYRFQMREVTLAREILYRTILDELPGWTRWFFR